MCHLYSHSWYSLEVLNSANQVFVFTHSFYLSLIAVCWENERLGAWSWNRGEVVERECFFWEYRDRERALTSCSGGRYILWCFDESSKDSFFYHSLEIFTYNFCIEKVAKNLCQWKLAWTNQLTCQLSKMPSMAIGKPSTSSAKLIL